jgi:hypothetical protein
LLLPRLQTFCQAGERAEEAFSLRESPQPSVSPQEDQPQPVVQPNTDQVPSVDQGQDSKAPRESGSKEVQDLVDKKKESLS